MSVQNNSMQTTHLFRHTNTQRILQKLTYLFLVKRLMNSSFFLGRQASASVKFEVDDISIVDHIRPALLTVLASSLQKTKAIDNRKQEDNAIDC